MLLMPYINEHRFNFILKFFIKNLYATERLIKRNRSFEWMKNQ